MKADSSKLAFDTMCDERMIGLIESFAERSIERHQFLEKFEMIMESHRFGLRKEVQSEAECGAV